MGLSQRMLDQAIASGLRATADAQEGSQSRAVQSANAQAERDARLEQLITGGKERQRIARENFEYAQKMAREQGMDPNEVSISASDQSINVAPRRDDMLSLYLKGQQIKDLNEDRKNRATQRFAAAAEKSGIPAGQVPLEGLATSIKSRGGVKLGPISGSDILPASVVSAGEQLGSFSKKVLGSRLGLPEEGATEQRQFFDQIKAAQRHAQYGANLTAPERRLFQDAMGALTGGTEEQRARAMETLAALHNKALQNLQGGFGEEIVKKYEEQGGIPIRPIDLGVSGPRQQVQQAPAQRTVTVRNAAGESVILRDPTDDDLRQAAADGYQVVR